MPVVVALLTTIVLGIPITLAIDRNARGTTLLGLAYLYGTGLIYFVELALALAGVHWTLLNVTLIAIVASIVPLAPRRGERGRGEGRARFNIVDAATLIVVAAYTSFATIARVWEWDFFAIWGLKARTFFDAGTIDWRFLQSPWNDFIHPDYPLLLPLNYVYASLTAGAWNDRWMGVITVAFGVALLLIVRGLAAMESTPLIAAAITFAATFFALSRFIGLAEAPMIAFAGAGALFVRRAILFDDDAAMRHGALLIGLAAATKNEGMAFLLAVVIALAFTKRALLLRLWPAFAIALPWIITRALHRFPTDLARGPFVERLFHRLADPIPVVALLIQYLTSVWMWVAILIGFVIVPAAERSRARFVLIASAVQIAIYIAIYLGTPNSVEWQIATSWSRLPKHVATPLLYVVMLMLARTYDSAHAEARSEHH